MLVALLAFSGCRGDQGDQDTTKQELRERRETLDDGIEDRSGEEAEGAEQLSAEMQEKEADAEADRQRQQEWAEKVEAARQRRTDDLHADVLDWWDRSAHWEYCLMYADNPEEFCDDADDLLAAEAVIEQRIHDLYPESSGFLGNVFDYAHARIGRVLETITAPSATTTVLPTTTTTTVAPTTTRKPTTTILRAPLGTSGRRLVGSEIEPGLYRVHAEGPTGLAYCERQNADLDIIANDVGENEALCRVAASDFAFSWQGGRLERLQ